MNTVLTIAEKYGYKLDEVLEIDYATVFVILLKEKISAEFHKNYMEVLRKDVDRLQHRRGNR